MIGISATPAAAVPFEFDGQEPMVFIPVGPRPGMGMTARQRDCFNFITVEIDAGRRAPTVRAIGRALGIGPVAASDLVGRLVARGFLKTGSNGRIAGIVAR